MKLSLLPLALWPSLITAARLTLHIPTTPLANPSTLPPTTHATLQSSGPPISARLTRSNSFLFTNVPPGSYLATIHCRDYIFEPLRIDVTIEEAVEGSGDKKEVIRAWQTFLGNEWENKGESRGSGGNGAVVEVKPVAKKDFFEERGGCELPCGMDYGEVQYADSGLVSPLSFLKNPMILMALFSLVLIVGMPYLMDNSKLYGHTRALETIITLTPNSGPRNQGRIRRDAEEERPWRWFESCGGAPEL